MKFNPFKELNKFEKCLWFISVSSIFISYLCFRGSDYLTLTASLIGVTALIFVAKGFVIGQVLTVVFSVFYGIISYYFSYYGEMITYLGMTTPIAIIFEKSLLRIRIRSQRYYPDNIMDTCNYRGFLLFPDDNMLHTLSDKRPLRIL